ncbi:sigma-70 family RNA polymerase sigma factor [Clostridium sp. MCC353]|uniref:RNA polymerase sigma factor n=1 Tax=Clostridium sp. MCC353 TaxID=2592646 RepID=UPI001C029598|nr:RNA polymerase sigma factor [Clostridium sp. MCC353]MBT9774921.1 sigma-70 family RNA polymerase sigma factor [Clostridium sp. MCC353]
MEREETNRLIDLAVGGDKAALDQLMAQIQDRVFNISLRMLGSVADAEDASQDILVRVMTGLPGFRKESSYFTWVYRIAVNYLINYKKSMFAKHPLDFEFYGQDIEKGPLNYQEDLFEEKERELLAEELKLSCTNVMLQCLDPQSRCIFILGTMFKVDSRIAGEILDMSPDNYRKKLSRIRKKVGDFLYHYCGLTKTGMCSCRNRVGYAVSQHRINPDSLEFKNLKRLDQDTLDTVKKEMELLDEASIIFSNMPEYRLPDKARMFIEQMIGSEAMKTIGADI